jgi:TIR domain-containing protein
MSFKYACFISYRHGQRATAEALTENLYKALAGEISLWLNEDVYLDKERLRGGDFYNEALSRALCQSVCMVVLFTPIYFDSEFTYCAREYLAMESLERYRLGLLGDLSVQEHGLIIPVVCRGRELLPDVIKRRRNFFDFEKYYLGSTSLPSKGKVLSDIQDIARYIRARYEELTNLPEDPTNDCTTFDLPSEAEVRRWIDSLRGLRALQAPFPGRARAG